MLGKRKFDILRGVVETYIETAQPVGSSALVSMNGLSVSSATIRNDMAYLEAEGYLEQPHTSAGRIPTQKGYRHFVDNLDKSPVDTKETRQVAEYFSQVRGEIEEVLKDTANLLSRLTECAAVVVDDPETVGRIISFQLILLHPRTVLALKVLDNGQVIKDTIELSYEVSEDSLADANQILSDSYIGQKLGSNIKLSKNNSDGNKLAQDVVKYRGSNSTELEKVYVDGTSRFVNAFEAVESVGNVLSILEQQLLVVSLLETVAEKGLSVSIGEENGIDNLANCSLVVAPFEVDGTNAGSVAVLGPTRMKYRQAMSVVAAVSDNLSDRLSEG